MRNETYQERNKTMICNNNWCEHDGTQWKAFESEEFDQNDFIDTKACIEMATKRINGLLDKAFEECKSDGFMLLEASSAYVNPVQGLRKSSIRLIVTRKKI